MLATLDEKRDTGLVCGIPVEKIKLCFLEGLNGRRELSFISLTATKSPGCDISKPIGIEYKQTYMMKRHGGQQALWPFVAGVVSACWHRRLAGFDQSAFFQGRMPIQDTQIVIHTRWLHSLHRLPKWSPQNLMMALLERWAYARDLNLHAFPLAVLLQ